MTTKHLFSQRVLRDKLLSNYPEGNPKVAFGATQATFDSLTGRLRGDKPLNTSGARVAREWLKYAVVFLLIFTLCIGNMWGQTEITTTSNPASSGTYTITCAKASGSTVPNTSYGAFVRCYAKNTITIGTTGSNMKEMHIVWSKNSSKTYASVSAGSGSYSHPSSPGGTGVWTGNASSVVFTVGSSGQIQLVSATIYTCVKPSAVAAGTITASSFGLSITDAANTNNYEVYFSTSNTAPTISTPASTTVTSKTPTISTGVAASTTYYVWVRSKCSNTSKSAWVALTGSTITTAAPTPLGSINGSSKWTYGLHSINSM